MMTDRRADLSQIAPGTPVAMSGREITDESEDTMANETTDQTIIEAPAADRTITIRHIKAATLTIHGTPIHVELLGKGRFSEAWRNGEHVYVITRERTWGKDYSKEMLASLDSDNPHIPKVERIGDLGESDVYRMPFYQPLTMKRAGAWQHFRELERICEQSWKETFASTFGVRFNPHRGIEMQQRVVDLVRESAVLPESLKGALEELFNGISNYGSTWAFEFAKRNLCVDEQGNLILLDVLFDMEVLGREQEARRKRAGTRY